MQVVQDEVVEMSIASDMYVLKELPPTTWSFFRSILFAWDLGSLLGGDAGKLLLLETRY